MRPVDKGVVDLKAEAEAERKFEESRLEASRNLQNKVETNQNANLAISDDDVQKELSKITSTKTAPRPQPLSQ
jgi:hypothetical protein